MITSEATGKQQRDLAKMSLLYALGFVLLAILVTKVSHSVQPTMRSVTVGTKDKIYYSHSAMKTDAERLGRALQSAGFLTDLGTVVRLSKGASGTVVSFVCDASDYSDPEAAFAFEELGLRVAGSIGGLPIKVRLLDSRWVMRRELSVGKTFAGVRDAVYYLGSATAEEAKALGQTLRASRYLVDAGTTVVLSRNGGTAISFIVADGAWDSPDQVMNFERLTGVAAASVGGLPITLHLLNSKMQERKQIAIGASAILPGGD